MVDKIEGSTNMPVISAVTADSQQTKSSRCFSFMPWKGHPPNGSSFLDSLKHAFMCPPHGPISTVVTYLILTISTGTTLYYVFDEDMVPGGVLLSLYILVVFCFTLGNLVQIFKLPRLMGLLIGGLIARNVPEIGVACCLNSELSSKLRSLALIVILTRAGIGLDPNALRKLSSMVVRLAFTPCIFEACTVGVVGHFFLSLPWSWSFMLGAAIAAVSPAVVVNGMWYLQSNGYGVDKGIPSLVVASASIDDILAISIFIVMLGISFSVGGNIALQFMRGILEAVAGFVVGTFLGVIAWYLPNKNHSYGAILKLLLMFFLNVALFFGSILLDISGAGSIGCLTLAFVAACGWRAQNNVLSDITKGYLYFWYVMEALLFGLIGTEMDLKIIDGYVVIWGLLTLCVGLTVRIIVAYLATTGGGFNPKEKLLVAIAWLPKATVQAALGPVALDLARSERLSQEYVSHGLSILTVAVLSILVTAPLGAFLVGITGPKLLTKSSEDPEKQQEVFAKGDH